MACPHWVCLALSVPLTLVVSTLLASCPQTTRLTHSAATALVRGEPVDPGAIYFRCAPTFEVSHPALDWMTQSLFIGTGARFPDRVEMRFFRVA